MTASYVSPADGTAFLTHRDLLTVLGALADAVAYRLTVPAAADFDLVVRYRAVSRGLGDDR